ncbi:related to ROG1 Protein with putative serine active lipase domain [Phialocephala subalpina]|uniref:Related to ROG1 Protein with putative serine active lipase domain n=1 Tax=Phialocephala subalpina TaxID=576137 RepID=A0A1L7XFR4_9HELO|nr:related to ROG1 Protein with putative serine active lipase domain [Phialocephala subalpina]
MLLLYQTGSVKIGEVVRYTITYTPSHDRILPSPAHLHLKIKNTSAIALRAAFVHGPYTLYTAAYPKGFQTDARWDSPRTKGVPEFEPQLKAGGNWGCRLLVPEDVRATAGKGAGRSPARERHGHATRNLDGEEEPEEKSVSWIVEVSSQVIFSNSAAVHYEILLGRDEKSLSLGFAGGLTGNNAPTPQPGQLSDHQQSVGARDGHHGAQPKGVFSKAISVKVDDTASLWNTPKMPEWGDKEDDGRGSKRQKKVHLVVVTHGLHSNLGADMLFLKESIDATARKAKVDARARRARRRSEEKEKVDRAGEDQKEHHDEARKDEDGKTKLPATQLEEDLDEDEDEEEVIVRGFSGNAVRTERGIKYLGKRLAKYVLQMTYPDQPYKPVTKKSAAQALSHALKPEKSDASKPVEEGIPSHKDSTILKEPYTDKKLAYKITSISFIAHSLGGLIQTYAVAYIQKHSPEFFDRIQPVNFIAMASPFLGLSNENPLYVKFALDFGLVGRTGQDLGLTWRAPTVVRSGWGAIVGGIGESAHKKIDGETAPESKPLLRILPTGPAHIVLKKFRNRTVYSNVVNDGIVPLRTSCLLFLDWQGLGRVEKARRENGLVGTMAGWGWAEITGANSSSPARRTFSDSGMSDMEDTETNTPTRQGHGADVPQPPPYATEDDDQHSLRSVKSIDDNRPQSSAASPLASPKQTGETSHNEGPLASIMKFFQPDKPNAKSHNHTPKYPKIYKRSQTLRMDSDSSSTSLSKQPLSKTARGKATTGDTEHDDQESLSAPPKTTFFESAGDVLKPPLPSVDFLIDPSSRPRTIFHDRVYHPEDIPPPPLKKRPTSSLMLRRGSSVGKSATSTGSTSSDPFPTNPPSHTNSTLSAADYDDTKNTGPDKDPRDVVDGSAMKVEEKIARAYHRDLSWRKVLVRLEPDAHNNMIVRRMFANAYGWPVVKHLCDTHFSDSTAANTRDDDEGSEERAKGENEGPAKDGGETNDGNVKMLSHEDRTDSEAREAKDHVPALVSNPKPNSLGKAFAGNSLAIPGESHRRPQYDASSGTEWSERDWADSEVDSEDEEDRAKRNSGEAKKGGWNWTEAIAGKGATSPRGTDKSEVDKFLGKKNSNEGKKSPSLSLTREHARQLESDAAAARVLSGEAAGMGLGLQPLGPQKDGEGIVGRESVDKDKAKTGDDS